MRRLWFALVAIGLASAEQGVQDAVAALQRGDFAGAEEKLRAELRVHPNDAGALTLLGVALDGEKRFDEAGAAHRAAVASGPGPADALNNYGNHFAAMGDEEGARKLYLQVIARDPAHFNANVQLARLALKGDRGAEALECLQRLPPNQQASPNIQVLKMEALYRTGDAAKGDALAGQLAAAGRSDLALSFAAGIALSKAGQFEKAEGLFTQALALAPADFNVLANLGIVASHAGHYDRARESLETALRQQPDNVELLYNLAYVDEALKEHDAAIKLLARAARLAPRRADVQKLLAITTGGLGALEDAAAAWDRYLQVEPGDEAARRERGFTAVQMGLFEQGAADLRWFVERHPGDAVGHYELGMAESKDNLSQGLVELDKAIQLKADFVAALSARGGIYYQMGKPEAAVKDLESATALQPEDAVCLDRLGQTYLALDRASDAVKVLRKAAGLAPDDSKTQLHFARALADAGQSAESKAVMERFRELGPAPKKGVPAGLVDFLSLSPEERRADYRIRLEKLVREHPDDAAAQVSYLKLLLDDGKQDEASAVARRIAVLKPGGAVLADAGRALLEARQYAGARDILREAARAGAAAEVELDLAVAAFHAAGAAEGLRALEQVREAGRNGDYYLAKARILEASGSSKEAAAALEQALRAASERPELYRQAAVLRMEGGRAAEALPLLDAAARALPRDREIPLLRAAALEFSNRTGEAEKALAEMQNRWPEWNAPWAAQGAIQAAHGQCESARRLLETAVALGAHSAEMYFYLAECSQGTGAETAIAHALQLAPADPWIQALAGRIALDRGDSSAAVQRLSEAVRLRPEFGEAHQDLARAYEASGRKTEAAAELAKAGKILPGPGSGAPYLRALFLIKPPRDW